MFEAMDANFIIDAPNFDARALTGFNRFNGVMHMCSSPELTILAYQRLTAAGWTVHMWGLDYQCICCMVLDRLDRI